MNSRTGYSYRKHLHRVAKSYNVHIVWVPGHNDVPGSCRADELARRGTTIELSGEFFNIGVRLWTCKLMIDDEIADSFG